MNAAAGPSPGPQAGPAPDSVDARIDAAPALGQHADAILAERDHGASQIERLRAHAAI